MLEQTLAPPVESAQSTTRRRARRDWAKFIFIAPAILWIVAFTLFPTIFAARTAFFSFRNGKEVAFVGWSNFRALLTDDALHEDLGFTLMYVVIVVAIEMVLGFLLALLFNRRMRGLGILRTIMSLPLFASPVALGFLGLTIFYEIDGPVNQLLTAIGVGPKPWISDPVWARVAIIIIDIWQWTPFVFLVALAGLQGLPQDIIEAAEVDGASWFQVLRSITIPLMTPILWLILLLRTIDAFKVVDVIVSMTQGGPGRATEHLSFYIFKTARKFLNYGGAAAQGFLLLLIVMFLVSLIWGRIRDIYDEPAR
jgi:multiple sugar transport system permease protein